jgi:molybdopterin converting factor small subunit
MIVKVRIFGYLRNYAHQKLSREFEVTLPNNATAAELSRSLGIPEDEEKIILVNDAYTHGNKLILKDNDAVSIYPFVGGG